MTPVPFRALTTHFATTLLAPPLLTDLGADYLRRTIASVVAMVLVVGIFLTRIFFRKYTDLGGLTYPDAYLRALQSDTLFMIAVPMLVVGAAAVLLCPLLFPDETDYQVLSPLPVTRATIFGAKLAAVLIAGGAIVFAVAAITSFWFPLATGGRRAPHPATARAAAHAVATVAGAAWMFLAVAALQGLSLVVLPAGWRRLGHAMQGAMIVVLLVSAPFVSRLPAATVSAETVLSLPLIAFPPTWFFGLEQWLLNPARLDGYAIVAGYAAWALVVTLATIAAAYLRLYGTAERLASLSAARRPVPRRRSLMQIVETRVRLRPPAAGVIDFVLQTLSRSRLHQFVFALAAGCGVAALLGQIVAALTADSSSALGAKAAVHATLAAPLLAALTVTLALRAAFLLPSERGAAWVFRLTETPAARTASLDAVAWCFIAPVLAATAIAAAAVNGPTGWPVVLLLTWLLSLGLIEAVLGEWNRIPFTCSYLPGKRVLAYSLGVLLGAYFVFVYLGAHVLRGSLTTPLRAAAVASFLTIALAIVRRIRLRTWGRMPLDFEDFDPMAVRTLGLLPDER